MDKKNRIKRAYNETADFYNSRYKEIQYEKYRTIFASPYLSAENLKCKILDLGCGTGLLLEFLKESKLPYIVGIDISAEMLKFSKEEKILGDVEMLPFKDNSFDLAFSFTVIQNLPTLKILEEVSRILKPDSIFAFTVLKKKLPTKLLQNLAKNKFTILEKLDSNEDCGFICRNEKIAIKNKL
ncbi:MAG: class I SAM-dependent methyltransferase [Candidatus Thermoplasmatota archaeon]|nr:class I SAM-dependent methyltransferase [Candidatus Thermoplasmatota archaeon]